MTRENRETKGRRLVAEGRLNVVKVDPSARAAIVATCRGDSADVYDLGYDAQNDQWRCTCEARGLCSHLVALQLVTTIPRRPTR